MSKEIRVRAHWMLGICSALLQQWRTWQVLLDDRPAGWMEGRQAALTDLLIIVPVLAVLPVQCFSQSFPLLVFIVLLFCPSSFRWPGSWAALFAVTTATLPCGSPSSLVNHSPSSCMFMTTMFCTTERGLTDMGQAVVFVYTVVMALTCTLGTGVT